MITDLTRYWRTFLAISTGVAVSALLAGCGGPSAAQTIMNKIPGCSGISTSGGSSLDDNTISEGGCTLSGTTNLSIYVWAAGDVSDLEQYMSFAANPVYCCIVGSKPMPWAISLDTSAYAPSYAASLWAAVESALKGQAVTNPPSSWQDGSGNFPIGNSSASPSPSPTPSSMKTRSHRAHHVRAVAPSLPSSGPAPSPTSVPAPPPTTAASCYPLSDEGSCYEPGEFCRDSDHGMTGVAGDGEKIICEDNDGWRWDPY